MYMTVFRFAVFFYYFIICGQQLLDTIKSYINFSWWLAIPYFVTVAVLAMIGYIYNKDNTQEKMKELLPELSYNKAKKELDSIPYELIKSSLSLIVIMYAYSYLYHSIENNQIVDEKAFYLCGGFVLFLTVLTFTKELIKQIRDAIRY